MSAAPSLVAPPRTRADCVGPWAGIRPTPSCGACRFRIEGGDTCALDVIDERGALTLEEVGEYFFLTRERIRQIEAKALRKLRRAAKFRGLDLAALLFNYNRDSRTGGGEGDEP